jgi:nucleoside-diphosphate-sugar epimerase
VLQLAHYSCGTNRARINIICTAIITGSAGLIGSKTVKRFAQEGARVVGIDNDMRAQFFGAEASTKRPRDDLIANVRGYEHHDLDIRDASAVIELFKCHRGKIDAIVHTASQPSHDWAARNPQTDFTVNANGTLNLLEAARKFLPKRHLFLHRQIKSTATRRTGCRCANYRSDGKSSPGMSMSRGSPKP